MDSMQECPFCDNVIGCEACAEQRYAQHLRDRANERALTEPVYNVSLIRYIRLSAGQIWCEIRRSDDSVVEETLSADDAEDRFGIRPVS